MAKIVIDNGQLKGSHKKRTPLREVSIMLFGEMLGWLFRVQKTAVDKEAEERQPAPTESGTDDSE